MKGSVFTAALVAVVSLTACSTTGSVKPVHNFDSDSKVGDVTVTAKQKCHGANTGGGALAGAVVLGPIGAIAGAVGGSLYSHKECK